MKIAPFLLTAASMCVLTSSVLAGDPKDDLVAVMKAQNDAPAFRAKVVTAGSGVSMTVTMERVKPSLLHVKTEGGSMLMEVYSDGQKTLMNQGGGAFQEAPPQVATMLTQNSQDAMMQQAMQAAKNVKVAGHEAVNGAAATVYSYDAEMAGIQSSNKLWVSDKDHRPVKSESDVHGSLAGDDAGGTAVSMKVTSTFDYDPSIKVVMPAK